MDAKTSEGLRALASDPTLRKIIDRIGPPRIARHRDRFGALVRAIVYQQLSGKAAGTIHRRFVEACGNGRKTPREPEPEEILGTSLVALRSAGLSRQKIAYLQDLAGRTLDGRLPLDRLGRMSDDEIIKTLTEVKGIGRWTAEMFLIFSLGRPDVWPADDLGLRKAVQKAYRLREMPLPRALVARGERFRPFRSYATWYFWQSLAPGEPADPLNAK
ncbi:MAG: DNA-3-methyladenine glycosylase [Nitrospirota bacterium]